MIVGRAIATLRRTLNECRRRRGPNRFAAGSRSTSINTRITPLTAIIVKSGRRRKSIDSPNRNSRQWVRYARYNRQGLPASRAVKLEFQTNEPRYARVDRSRFATTTNCRSFAMQTVSRQSGAVPCPIDRTKNRRGQHRTRCDLRALPISSFRT